ncbi:MAG TPA: hypothetical protein VF992_09585 [Thermoplasmata archaeon]
MARRKRKEEEPDWVAPEFDEIGYMRREIQGARAAVATILWAVVGAIVAFLLFSVSPALAFFAGIAVAFGLYFILPLFGIKIDAFQRKDWAGHGITYFFSWLAVWIILLNPPFGDFTDPTVQGISVSPYSAGYTGDLPCYVPVGSQVAVPMGSPSNTSIIVLFRATDNVGLASLHVNVTPASTTGFEVSWTLLSGKSQCVDHRPEDYPAGTYNVTFDNTASSYTVAIVATDRAGHSTSASVVVLPQ